MNKLSALLLFVSATAALETGDACPVDDPVSIVNECTNECIDSCVIQAIALHDVLDGDEGGDDIVHYVCGCDDKTPAPSDSSVDNPAPADSPSTDSSSVDNPAPADSPSTDSSSVDNPAPADSPSTDSSSVDSPAPADSPSTDSSSVNSPAPTPDDKCSPAYDDEEYCLCPGPNPSPTYPEKIQVSVCGDATYLLDHDQVPCSGPVSKDPAGTACPKKGDTTTIACRDEIISYLTGGNTGTCKAPEDATCEKLSTGAWGCVFPGNCNTVNTCLEQPVCTEEYEKDSNGNCVVMDNGYVKPAENNTALYDTTELSELKQKVDTASASSTMFLSSIFVLVAAALKLY